jgi:hypothetical protein
MAKNIRIIPDSGSVYFIGDTGTEANSVQIAINNSSNNVKIYDGQTGRVFVFFDKTNLRTEFSSSMNLYATSSNPPASVGGVYYNTTDGNIYRSNGSTWLPAAGSSGTSGATGAKGQKGEIGAPGPQGNKGNTGAPGPQGNKGNTGAPGPQGNKGDTGAPGPQGNKGDTGAPGPQGNKGDTGAPGPQGNKGNTGAPGPQGNKGNTGSPGPQGNKGQKGEIGAPGPQGNKGNTGGSGTSGSSGTSGATGGKGQKGEVGAPGGPGAKGNTGSPGSKGQKGEVGGPGGPGPKGNTGSKGNTGTGTKGQKGETGSNAGITSFTNGADNRVVTATSSTGLNAEANLTFDGTDLRCTGDIIAYYSSDARLKDNITPIENALSKVLTLSGVKWDWNENASPEVRANVPNVGLIAQEVQQVLPEVVTERKDGYLALDYNKLIGLLVEAIKELANK